MMLFALSAALALPLELHTSPGASLEVLPPVVEGRTDVVLHGNRVDLDGQVAWSVETGVARARTLDLGGDWFLMLEMASPDTTVRAEATPYGFSLTTVPLEGGERPAQGPPDLAGALAGRLDDHTCPGPALAIAPLSGHASRWYVDALGDARLPVWSAAEPSIVSWAEFADTRTLAATAAAGERPTLLYRLGAIARDLGHHREAAYYFGLAADAGAPAPARFQAAGAQLEVRNWAGAAASARRGVAAGGAPEVAIEVLGRVELVQGGPHVAGYGRVLAASAVDPDAHLLAGVLLADAGCIVEGKKTYERAVRHGYGAQRELARMLLAESHLAAGDLPAAARGFGDVDGVRLESDTRRVLRGRTRLLAILDASPRQWGSFVPDVAHEAARPAEAGAEALYQLAQLYAHLGEERESLEAYADLMRRYPRLATTPIATEYAQTWLRRLDRLFAEGRTLEALALHRAAWSPALADQLTDPEPLRKVALAYGAEGLRDRALMVWRSVADLERVHGLDGRESVRQLARLYVANGNYEDAMDAVDWLRRQRPDAVAAAEYAVLEGRAALSNGEPARARRAWASAADSAEHGLEARTRVALLDARDGHCDAAITPLEGAAAAAPVPEVDDELVREALVRCLLATGRAPEATTQAILSAGLAPDDAARDWTTYRAARMDGETAGAARPLLADAAQATPGIWGALAKEELAQRDFSDRLRRRKP